MDRLDDDGAIIGRVLRGARDDFAHLVTRYQGLVFTVVLKMVKDRRIAEELMQEAFLKAYRKLSTLKDPGSFKAWLVQIATNETLRTLRKKDANVLNVDFSDEKAAALFRDEARELSMLGVEEAAEKFYRLERVGKALDELSLTYRTPIILRYYAKLSYAEIAERMDLSLAATKFRLHYGVRLLKALVTKA